MHSAWIKPAGETLHQVGAMKRIIRSAVLFPDLAPVGEFEKITGLHVAGVDARRQMPDRGDLLADTDRSQRFDGLRTGIDRSSDFAEFRSGLENVRSDAKALERVRGCRARQSAADDRYHAARCHSFLRAFPQRRRLTFLATLGLACPYVNCNS